MTWIDYNTLSLLFGMMVIVGLLRDTGFFEFAAVKAYKIAQGNFWKYAPSYTRACPGSRSAASAIHRTPLFFSFSISFLSFLLLSHNTGCWSCCAASRAW
jgi:hypothetical protein